MRKQVKTPTQRRLKWAYHTQKAVAKTRDIPFTLSFAQWFKIWVDSGHLHERGRRSGQYCMARNGDVGPYAIGNVKIITHAQNVRDGRTGRIMSPAARAKVSAAKLGKPGRKQSPETRAKLSAALLGNKNHLGHKLSLESRAKIGAAQRARYINSIETRK